jgi:hypothetical protein
MFFRYFTWKFLLVGLDGDNELVPLIYLQSHFDYVHANKGACIKKRG